VSKLYPKAPGQQNTKIELETHGIFLIQKSGNPIEVAITLRRVNYCLLSNERDISNDVRQHDGRPD